MEMRVTATDIEHPARSQLDACPVVFTAHAAETAYLRERICAYVLAAGAVPINPFMCYGYFLYDLVPKDVVRRANNNLVMRCDELWSFGPISDGVAAEIDLANRLSMPIRQFEVDHHGERFTERQPAAMTPSCETRD